MAVQQTHKEEVAAASWEEFKNIRRQFPEIDVTPLIKDVICKIKKNPEASKMKKFICEMESLICENGGNTKKSSGNI